MGDARRKGAAAVMRQPLFWCGAARDSIRLQSCLPNSIWVLHESRVGGFATCLCAENTAAGEVILANAGTCPHTATTVRLTIFESASRSYGRCAIHGNHAAPRVRRDTHLPLRRRGRSPQHSGRTLRLRAHARIEQSIGREDRVRSPALRPGRRHHRPHRRPRRENGGRRRMKKGVLEDLDNTFLLNVVEDPMEPRQPEGATQGCL